MESGPLTRLKHKTIHTDCKKSAIHALLVSGVSGMGMNSWSSLGTSGNRFAFQSAFA